MGNSGNDKGKCWVGVDLGGTKLLAAVLDPNFAVVARLRKRTKAHEGAQAGLERIERSIAGVLEEAGLNSSQLAGVGVGVPGNLDLREGVLIKSPNLGWRDVKIRDRLQRSLGCSVTVINDVDAGVYGEYARGAAKDARCVVGVFPGTGIGGGCVYEGALLTGGARSCMEIGHIPVVPDGPLCGCGNRGCLETVASRLAIAGVAAAAAYRGDAPHLMATAGCDVSEIRTGALVESIREGDKAVETIVRQAAYWLGRGVAVLVNLFAPDIVLLGGGLVEGLPEIYQKEVQQALKSHVMPAYLDTYRVAVAKLGDDAVAIGAAAWAQRCAKKAS